MASTNRLLCSKKSSGNIGKSLIFLGLFAPVLSYIHPSFYDAPEKMERIDDEDAAKLKPFSFTSLGDLFAGRAEFPWLMDIRIDEHDQEVWSIGNLITARHILTTCRTVTYLIPYVTNIRNYKEITRDQTLYKYPYIRAGFCENYSWENYQFKIPLEDIISNRTVLHSGTRTVMSMAVHPDCAHSKVTSDIGVLRLMHILKALPPALDYAHIYIHKILGFSPDFDLRGMERENRVCYVASYGRNYNNLINHMVLDYKTKLRVYFQDRSSCQTAQALYPCTYAQTKCDLERWKNVDRTLICMQSRNAIGNICDHDRGAAVVCDGLVFGMVVRAVKLEYCSAIISIPFLVLKMRTVNDLYLSMIESYFQEKVYNFKGIKSDHRPRSLGIFILPNGFIILCLLVSHWYIYRIQN